MMNKLNDLLFVIGLFLFATPVFACKMTRDSWENKSQAEAKSAVTKKTGQKDLHARREKLIWIVRTKKPSCVEYKVKVEGSSTCKFSSQIISMNPCH